MELFTGEGVKTQIPFFTHSFLARLSKSLFIHIGWLGKEEKEGGRRRWKDPVVSLPERWRREVQRMGKLASLWKW